MASQNPFGRLVETHGRLRELVLPPGDVSVKKVISYIDENARRFIAQSPYVTIATSAASGVCDASPRGGEPGFVRVIDENHLLIPEASGNRRADTIGNIIENGNIGALFLLPGYEETLRVNGRAVVTEDASVLRGMVTGQGRLATIGIGIIVEECFLHCAKASMRSSLWNPLFWPDLIDFPTPAAIMKDHTGSSVGDGSLQDMEALLTESYTNRL